MPKNPAPSVATAAGKRVSGDPFRVSGGNDCEVRYGMFAVFFFPFFPEKSACRSFFLRKVGRSFPIYTVKLRDGAAADVRLLPERDEQL